MAKHADSSLRNGQTPKRRLIADRAARWVVSAGGIAIICSILGILIFIVLEVLPLTYSATVGPSRRVRIAGAGAIRAVVADEHRSHVAALDDRGQVRIVRLDDGKVVYTADLLAGPHPPAASAQNPHPSAPSPAPSLPTSPGEGNKSRKQAPVDSSPPLPVRWGGRERKAGEVRGYRPETWVTDRTGDIGDSLAREDPGKQREIPGCLGARRSR